jgi:ribosome maturation factor RimP
VEDLVKQIKCIVTGLLSEHKVHLIDLEVKGRPGSQIVKVFIDTDSGIRLEQCEKISRELSDILDIEDIMPGKYILEVSSPGIARPLRTPYDFRRNLNRIVQVTFQENNGQQVFEGKVLEASEDSILLQGERETLRIAISTIQHGKVSLPW